MRRNGGFTLLEVLVAAAIFAIIMVAVYMMYETSHGMFQRGESRAAAQQNARIALDDMAAAVRMAGSFHPSPLCRPAGSQEAVRIATDDTLALHGGYRDPDPAGGPGQDCNVYITYGLWSGGVRGTTLRKETRCDAPWGEVPSPCGLATQNPPLAENVTRLLFRYYDVHGQPVPTTLPGETAPVCPSDFPDGWPRQSFALDGQGPVSGGAVPSPVTLGSQRAAVRVVRIEVTVESYIAGGEGGCFRRNAGGATQAYTLVSEAHLRGLVP